MYWLTGQWIRGLWTLVVGILRLGAKELAGTIEGDLVGLGKIEQFVKDLKACHLIKFTRR